MGIVFYSCLLLVGVLYNVRVDAAKTSGPYKVTITRAEHCKQPTYPYDVDPPMTSHLEIYNTSKRNFLMRGNVTAYRENNQVKLKLKSLIWQNGEWKLMTLLNNIACHSVVLHLIMSTVGVAYNRETCGFVKGHYHFEGIDPDVLYHLWRQEFEYGRILTISETIRRYSTYACWELETFFEPL